MIHAMEVADTEDKNILQELMIKDDPNKVVSVLAIFKKCKVDEWAKQLQQNYFETALQHLEDTAVLSVRKKPLLELAEYLMVRES